MQGFAAAQQNATALANNPYLAQIGAMGNQFMQPGSTPSLGQMGQVAQQLEQWHGLKPGELSALTLQAANAAQSAAATMKQQMGGVANPALLMHQLAGQAGQTGAQAAVQLGSLAQQQELGATEAAGGIYGQMTADQIQKMQDALEAYTQQSGQYLAGQQAAGGINLGAGQGFSGLSSQNLAAILNSLGLQTQGAQLGAGMLQGAGNTYQNLLGSYLSSPMYNQNPYSSFFSNLAGIVPANFGSNWFGGGNQGPGFGGYSTPSMPPGFGGGWS
jgi:hypothetical protein